MYTETPSALVIKAADYINPMLEVGISIGSRHAGGQTLDYLLTKARWGSGTDGGRSADEHERAGREN